MAVVYNAPDKVSKVQARDGSTSRDLVYIGSFMPYKNVETLVAGVGLLPGFRLHLLSKISPVRKSKLEDLAQRAGAELIFHNGVSDEKYKELLNSSFALVSASKDEGFGIPLVEAMQLGTPVIVSNLDIFTEVAADAGTFFDPESPEQFAHAVSELKNKNNWANKSNKSIAQVDLFDWTKSAEALLKQFEELES